MHSFILEIFSEEIPAKLQIDSLYKFKEVLSKFLLGDIQAVVSPRHMCFFIKNLQLNQKILIKGPKINANLNAIEGFLKKYNAQRSDLIEKDGVFFLDKIISIEDILHENILKAFSEMTWPNSMMWNNHSLRWIRPIHSILCMLNEQVLPIQLEHIKASNVTYGHRSHQSKKIVLKRANFDDYCNALKEVDVIVSQNERRQLIESQIEELVRPLNLTLLKDEKLLDEIVGLVENPYVLLGKIDEEFMYLPKEILITTLKNNQKYLLLQNANQELASYFIIVSDIIPKDNGETIISGNEKVLKARLSDAQHFMKSDLQIPFSKYSEKLTKIQFHKDIGNMQEKVIKMNEIAEDLCNQLNIDFHDIRTAISLCKNDLVTQMVSEFPELQGIVGYYYALHNQENETTAKAIRDHYKPVGPKDSLPEMIAGCIVAISDKLHTLQSFFNIGIKPTSTKDPYALRRAAIGILRIISENNILHKIKLRVSTDLRNFILERAKHMNADMLLMQSVIVTS